MRTRSQEQRQTAAASLALVLLVLAVFLPLRHAGFVAYDDDAYVTENAHVLQGLTTSGISWALTDVGTASNWHPVTWVSHLLDVQLFGLDPLGHHATSVALHALNAILLLLLLSRMTGKPAPSLLVAALFAVHPLHVESVAWVSERKDVLSTCLLLLTLAAYLRYARKPTAARAWPVAAACALGLAAKPMLVSLPLLLLVLDFWPLGRWRAASWRWLVVEKLPLGLAAALTAGLALVAQRAGGSLAALQGVPLGARLENAAVSAAVYLGRMLWPLDLAAFYPYPAGGIPTGKVALAAGLLLALTAVVWRLATVRQPAPLAGWCWYLATLLPVLGIVQAGSQAHADRYTYVPLVGIWIAAAWAPRARGPRALRWQTVVAAALGVALLGALAARQAGFWRDSRTLFAHAIAATGDNWLMENNLGKVFFDAREYPAAEPHFAAAVRLRPDYVLAHYNLGLTLFWLRRYRESAEHLAETLRLRPDFTQAREKLDRTLARERRSAAADRGPALGGALAPPPGARLP